MYASTIVTWRHHAIERRFLSCAVLGERGRARGVGARLADVVPLISAGLEALDVVARPVRARLHLRGRARFCNLRGKRL